jgi:hypothetical protein
MLYEISDIFLTNDRTNNVDIRIWDSMFAPGNTFICANKSCAEMQADETFPNLDSYLVLESRKDAFQL